MKLTVGLKCFLAPKIAFSISKFLRSSDKKDHKKTYVRPMTLIFWQKTLNAISLKVRKNEEENSSTF